MSLTWSIDRSPDYGFTRGRPYRIVLSADGQPIGWVDEFRSPLRYVPRFLDYYFSGSLVQSVALAHASALPSDAMGTLLRATNEELSKAIQCSMCRRLQLPWSRTGKEPPDVCSHDHFWMEWRERAACNPGSNGYFIASGAAYHIAAEFPRDTGAMRGFGGSAMAIRMNDGRSFFSTNVWTQGDIPKHLLGMMQDTATIIHLSSDRRTPHWNAECCNCGQLRVNHAHPVVQP